HERLPELSPGLVMGFSFDGNFNCFQNGMISSFGEERVCRVRICRSRGVHGVLRFLLISYASTARDGRLPGRAAVDPAFARPSGPPLLPGDFAREWFEHAPDVLREDLLTARVRMNLVCQIQLRVA